MHIIVTVYLHCIPWYKKAVDFGAKCRMTLGRTSGRVETVWKCLDRVWL